MSDYKPIASLNPKLLARKGGAKPAMRNAASALAVQHDDLGWNDMGEVISLHSEEALPEVVRRQRALARTVSDKRQSAFADGRRAAFTLRLDAERHLKLRLACTVLGKSAQQLVTDALDSLLNEAPDLAALAALAAKKRH
ncbi:MAG: hypothetical protein ABL912_11015 [Novosphingobium sp.]